MKILIIDDDADKVGKLVAVLSSCGLARGEIHVSRSSEDARSKMRSDRYDVAILDLLLPLHDESEPHIGNSLSLLRDVQERDEFFKPGRLIGFTAFSDAASLAAPEFSEALWTIVVFDETSNGWEEQFRKLIAYLQRSRSHAPRRTYEADLCLIAALPEPELLALHRLPWKWESSEPIDDSTFVRRGRLSSNGKEFRVVSACCARMGNVASALLTSKLIEHFRPRFIAMSGICAGIRQKVNLGDAVLFSPSWEWASGKLVPDEEAGAQLEPAPHQIPVAEFVLGRAEELRKDQSFWLGAKAGFRGNTELIPKLVIAPGASGPTVIAHGNSADAIRIQHRKLTAIDMEVYGMCAAAVAATAPRPTVFAIKGVSDFADEEKNDSAREYAAHMSAIAIKEFFERYLDPIHALAGT